MADQKELDLNPEQTVGIFRYITDPDEIAEFIESGRLLFLEHITAHMRLRGITWHPICRGAILDQLKAALEDPVYRKYFDPIARAEMAPVKRL